MEAAKLPDTFPFADDKVAAIFTAMAAPLRKRLLEVRDLILTCAESVPETGGVLETLKWGEPAYLPKRPRVGTTVRINGAKNAADRYGVYFHCQTTLLDSFRQIYPDSFAFEGNRAIILPLADPLPVGPIRHCVTMALTYHRRGIG